MRTTVNASVRSGEPVSSQAELDALVAEFELTVNEALRVEGKKFDVVLTVSAYEVKDGYPELNTSFDF